jgi:Holliday junction resolvase RusA-like endonuclease
VATLFTAHRSIAFESYCDIPTTTHQRKKIIRIRPRGRPEFLKLGNTLELDEAIARWDQILAPHRPARPLAGAIRLEATFVWPWRESEPRRNRLPEGIPHTSRPDLSNLIKTIEDRLMALGFIEDDARISEYGHCAKHWGPRGYLCLTLTEIDRVHGGTEGEPT